MPDFEAKMHQIRFRLAGAPPQTAGGANSAPPDPLAGFGHRFAAGGGAGLGKRRDPRLRFNVLSIDYVRVTNCFYDYDYDKEGAEGREGKWRGRKGRAPKLLLNQGPSETCYATVSLLLKY